MLSKFVDSAVLNGVCFLSLAFPQQQESAMPFRLFTNTYLKKASAKHNGWCFKCHEEVSFPEIVIVCQYKNCPNTFHLGCMQITTFPSDKWICPWHKCAEEDCHEPPLSFCARCPKAICQMHSTDPVKHECNWYAFCVSKLFPILTKTCSLEYQPLEMKAF